MKFPTPNGKAPAICFPGGYSILYLDNQGDIFCASCAESESVEGPLQDFAHWEGPPLECDDCGKTLESEYGDPGTEKAPEEG